MRILLEICQVARSKGTYMPSTSSDIYVLLYIEFLLHFL